MRPFLSLIAMLLASGAMFAQGPKIQVNPAEAAARARTTLILVHAERERIEAAATAKAALILAKCQRGREDCLANDAGCLRDLGAALATAKATSQPLFLWVGMSCERSIRDQFPTAVHCHLETMNGDKSPRVVVGKPGATYYRFERKDFTPATPADIRRSLQPRSQIAAPVRSAPC